MVIAEIRMSFNVGDIVLHRTKIANVWGPGLIISYNRITGLYRVSWGDGQERNHTAELLKQIA
jgi:uncharacterized protein YodC (DUF2158 family)|tara:strand:+ start:86 stop:274 length:189 start_codon:yes stop_codon:yes gene_type:complete